MADSRSIVTGASIALALVCAGWAIYESKHQAAPGGFAGAQQGRPGAGGTTPAGARPGAATGGGGDAIPVLTATAERRQINVGIEAIGTANSNESVSVTSKATNMITAIRFTDGQRVSAGQVLVELDRAQTEADLAAANAAFAESQSQFNRSRELFNTQALSKSQYEQLEATMKSNQARVDAAKARLADTYIRAPFSGRVGLRRVSLGTLISPGTVITTLDDTSSIKVDFAVPELNVGELRPGQAILARSSAYPGRTFTGRVVSVDSRVDPGSRAVTVRAVVPNGDGALKPGMFLTVDLSKERRAALMVPEQALVPEQARQFIYVVQGPRVAKREVKLGRREPGFVEITDGLSAGDHVVVEGTLKLRDGSLVRELGGMPATATVAGPAPPS
ncbi:MAG TPA: efflux RND transporter periplasmic adaptor subunit [Steroidobacteraceae bacterium]|nr:efflux RND transporter periplasmic adaptor subunit [Steroidobacteraceae bacterium]